MPCDRIQAPYGMDVRPFTVAAPTTGPWVRPVAMPVHQARTWLLGYGPQLLRTDPPPVLAPAPRS